MRARQCLDQRRFAVIDMPRRADNDALCCVGHDPNAVNASFALDATGGKIQGSNGVGLFCDGDFVDDGLCGGARVGGGKNRAADHEKVGAGANRLLWRSFAGLIVGRGRYFGIFRAHAGSNDQKTVAASFANGFTDGPAMLRSGG